MAKIAYILLCHKDPDAIIKQARRLTAVGDYMSIHFDARADPKSFARIKDALSGNKNVVFAKRIKCGWGEWSLVEATLNAVSAAVAAYPRASHFYMLSGDCMPIKSANFIHQYLDANDKDFVESFDFMESDWIKTGMKEERLIYRHFFNERSHKGLFYNSIALQKKLGLTRKIPGDLQIMIGSQWWCLRRRTVEAILEYSQKNKDVMRFFRTSWIPDETFFQTLVRHLVPESEIESRTLTFLIFSDYGMPVSFYDDQYGLLLSQDFLFARKISPEALELKRKLGELYASGKEDFQISNEGRTLFKYLTKRGRTGRRFNPRFWERESTLGRDRELLIIICKKWHVAKRLVTSAKSVTGLSGVEYLFDEDSADLPDLGGIQSTREKRNRHRRAMMRMLFDFYKINRLMICLDPNNMDLLVDFHSDRCTTKVLEIDCIYDANYLKGHALRTGLAGESTTEDTLERLLPTIRQDIAYESDQIRDADFPHNFVMSERNNSADNAAILTQFFDISEAQALEIAKTNHLFAE